MESVSATLKALLFAAVAALLFFFAWRQDLAGTMQNLIADVLTAAVIAATLREIYVIRARHRLESDLARPYQELLALVQRQEDAYRKIADWASQRMPAQSIDDIYLGSFRLTRAPDLALLRAGLTRLEADYGTLSFAQVLVRLSAAQETVEAVSATAVGSVTDVHDRRRPIFLLDDRPCGTNADDAAQLNELLTEVGRSLRPLFDELDLIRQLLDFYAPRKLAQRRRPEPFARWLLWAIGGLGLICVLVTAAAVLFPTWFPPGFGSGTLNNMLSAGVAGFVGAIFLVVERHRLSRAVLVNAAAPGSLLLNAMVAIDGAMGMTPAEDRVRLLRSVVSVVHDAVNQLHHAISDPRLDRYADDVIAELEAAIARPAADDHLDIPASTMTALGLDGMRPPAPATSRLLEASSRLSDCVYEMVFERGG